MMDIPQLNEQDKLSLTQNLSTISLIPKEKNADRIQNFRSICLLNVSYKILTKVFAARLARVIDKLIPSAQTAFLKGRFIMEGVVTLHGILHELHRKKKPEILFKVDFKKAYDKVKWHFLYKTLHMKGFPSQWIDWILKVVSGQQ